MDKERARQEMEWAERDWDEAHTKFERLKNRLQYVMSGGEVVREPERNSDAKALTELAELEASEGAKWEAFQKATLKWSELL